MARANARRIARAGRPRIRRSRCGPARHAAPISDGRRVVALVRLVAETRRLPGRRHGARQDDPGAGAAPLSQAASPTRRSAAPACPTRLAARELAGGDRSLRAVAGGARGPPVGDDGERARGDRGRGPRRHRSRHHDVRHARAHGSAPAPRVVPGDPRRGAGDQEPGSQTDASRESGAGTRAPRAHGNAGREPAR